MTILTSKWLANRRPGGFFYERLFAENQFMVMAQGKGRSKQWVWAVNVSGTGETAIELPRWVRSWSFAVEDLPGVPVGSNSSDPSWVDIYVEKTPFWKFNLAILSWAVSSQKLATFVMGR